MTRDAVALKRYEILPTEYGIQITFSGGGGEKTVIIFSPKDYLNFIEDVNTVLRRLLGVDDVSEKEDEIDP